jgi:hypothetical protein
MAIAGGDGSRTFSSIKFCISVISGLSSGWFGESEQSIFQSHKVYHIFFTKEEAFPFELL